MFPASTKKAGQRRVDSDTTLPRRIAVGPMLARHSLLAFFFFTSEQVFNAHWLGPACAIDFQSKTA